MTTLTTQRQHELVGGDWGFWCGAAIGFGIVASIASGAAAVGPAMLLAENVCTAEYVIRS